MARGDIKAGGAYVELALKDASFVKGLDAAGKKLKDFGGGMAKIGGTIAAVGSGLLAPLAAAVTHFAEFGSALNDMSARTGASASLLAELGHAAGMTGASMEDVEKAMTAMVRNGLDPATFKEVAAGIMQIQDPTERAGKALEIFGKSGMRLLPMLEDLDSLAAEANMLGLVPTDAQVAAADELGDAMDRAKNSVMGLAFQVGAALAETVKEAAGQVVRIVTAAAAWIQRNKELVVTAAKVAAGIAVVGGLITGLGLTIAGAGVVLSGLATGIAALGTVLGVVVSPLGLVVGALVGGVTAWALWTKSGQDAVNQIAAAVAPLLETFKQTFGGITNAIMSGEWALAGQIAMAGLKLVLLQGVAAIANAVGGAFGDFLGTLGTQILDGDLSGAWDTVVAGMASIWDSFCEGLVAVFTQAARAVTDVWEKSVNAIANTLLDMSSQGGVMGAIASKVLGVDMQAEDARKALLDMKAVELAKRRIADLENAKAGNVTAGTKDLTPEQIDKELEMARERLRKAQGSRGSATDMAKDFARQDIGGTADAVRARLDELDRAAQERSNRSADALRKRTAGGAAGANSAADAAQAELDKLTQQATQQRAKIQTAKQAGQQQAQAAAAGVPGAVGRVAGTFSAAAAVAIGQGGGPIMQVKKAIDNQTKQQMRDQEALRKAINEAGVIA